MSGLEHLAQLPANWDSYGALVVTEAAIESASRLMERPHVSPSPDGGVSVTWTNDHMEVDVTVLPDGTFGDCTVERFLAPTACEEPSCTKRGKHATHCDASGHQWTYTASGLVEDTESPQKGRRL